MNNEEIAKKVSKILETNIDNIIPRVKKLQRDIKNQEKKISELEERI